MVKRRLVSIHHLVYFASFFEGKNDKGAEPDPFAYILAHALRHTS